MSESRTYPMTAEALEGLRAELDHKLTVEKPAMAARLKRAIAMGDLKENAEYISAKEDHGFLQGRIDHLEEMILGSAIIEKSTNTDIAQLGGTVTVVEDGESDTETFMIVGAVEANPSKGKISNESPLGLALLNKKVGNKVSIDAPAGKLYFTIKKIE